MGCFVAAIVLASINDVLIVLNVDTEAVTMAEGLLIFAAVIFGKFGQSARRPPLVGHYQHSTGAKAGGDIPPAG